MDNDYDPYARCTLLDEPSSLLSGYLFDNGIQKYNDEIALSMGIYALQHCLPESRARVHPRRRVHWDRHVQETLDESPYAFARMYRMEYDSFLKLHSYLSPLLSQDCHKVNDVCGCPISSEIQLHCLLRWLSGGSYIDIKLFAGISVASFYRCIYNCIHGLLKCRQLAIKFPSTADEILQSASSFNSISNLRLVKHCVGSVDGILLKIQTPSSKECGHVKSFFSGHYHGYGINVQAVCDRHCRFTAVGIAAPGGTNDVVAITNTHIPKLIEELPSGYFIIGDNAYSCSENLLTPFSSK
jgi:DDE superfamily endonuclease